MLMHPGIRLPFAKKVTFAGDAIVMFKIETTL
jgi:hypothetical protein